MRVSWTNRKMLGEHGRQHDVRRDGGIAAEHAVDLRSRQPGIANRKLGGLAHEVEGGRALMPAECRQSDAGDEAHISKASCNFVIPGCAPWRRPGISRFRVRRCAAPRNDSLEFLPALSQEAASKTSAGPAPSRQLS